MPTKTIIKAATERLKSTLRSGVSRLLAGRPAVIGAPTAEPSHSLSALPRAADGQAPPQLSRTQQIEAEHAAILDLFEETARFGHVPADALIGRLHTNHCDQLAETKRQKGESEEALDALLRRLDARFPAPLPPEPEKPTPPRSKMIRALPNMWTKSPQPRPASTQQ